MSSAMEFYHIADILHSVFIFAQMILLGKQLCRDIPLDQWGSSTFLMQQSSLLKMHNAR